MSRKHFERGGSGVFTCATCARSTRRTDQPRDSTLCLECYELAGWENAVQDGTPVSEVAAARDSLVAACVKRGGDAVAIRENFALLWDGRNE